jgi:hypothetical protein
MIYQIIKILTRRFRTLVENLALEREWVVCLGKLKKTSIEVDSLIAPPYGFSYADPFVFEWNKITLILVEKINKKNRRGGIALLELRQGSFVELWDFFEDFHLSYPHPIFIDDNAYFIPESASNEDLRCYRFNLEGCRLDSVLMEGVEVFDVSFFRKNGSFFGIGTGSEKWLIGGTGMPIGFKLVQDKDRLFACEVEVEYLNDVDAFHRNGGQWRDIGAGLFLRPAQVKADHEYGKFLVMDKVQIDIGTEADLIKVTLVERSKMSIGCLGKFKWVGYHHFSTHRDLAVIDVKKLKSRFFNGISRW